MTRLAIEPEDVQAGVELPSLAVMDAVRATFALYRRHFLTIILTMGVLALPSVILPALVDFSLDQPPRPEGRLSTDARVTWVAESVGRWMFGTTIHTLVFAPLNALIGGATALIAANLVLGRIAGVGAAYRAAIPQIGRMVIADLLSIILAVSLAVTCIGILAIPYVYLGLEFVTQAVMLERRGPIAAFRRSWELARGHRWRILWSTLLAAAPTIIVMVLQVLAERWWLGIWAGSQISSLPAFLRADATMQAAWLVEVGTGVVQATFLAPLGWIMTVVLYLDLRARERPYQLPIRPLPDPVQPE